MKTRTWIALLAGVFAVCLGLSVFLLHPRTAAQAQISSQGQVVATVALDVDQEFTVATPDGGENTVTVRGGAIAVTEANCPDQYCVHRGFCSGGAQIVCLPNRLVIRFLGQQTVDGVAG